MKPVAVSTECQRTTPVLCHNINFSCKTYVNQLIGTGLGVIQHLLRLGATVSDHEFIDHHSYVDQYHQDFDQDSNQMPQINADVII